MSKVGRRPQDITYVGVTYQGREYGVGFLRAKDDELSFVFDADDAEKIMERSWHRSANVYIASAITVNDTRKQLYLHNLVMDRLAFAGKGQAETVDHITRNGFDNRKVNLRILNQTEQNLNQGRKPRTVSLPPDSGLTPDDIPRHIWYVKANGGHGDRFAIEIKTEGLVWRSSSSRTIPLKEKLEAAKAKLAEFYAQVPHLNPADPDREARAAELRASFDAIVAAAYEQLGIEP